MPQRNVHSTDESWWYGHANMIWGHFFPFFLPFHLDILQTLMCLGMLSTYIYISQLHRDECCVFLSFQRAWCSYLCSGDRLLCRPDLSLQVARWMQITAHVPLALSLHEVHTHSNHSIRAVNWHVWWRVCEAALCFLSWASSPLEFTTNLQGRIFPFVLGIATKPAIL